MQKISDSIQKILIEYTRENLFNNKIKIKLRLKIKIKLRLKMIVLIFKKIFENYNL